MSVNSDLSQLNAFAAAVTRRRTQAPLAVPVSVVVPARNEAENLPHVLTKMPRGVHEVIVVDGHSTDGTADVARELLPDAIVIDQVGRGKGDALRTGFERATGDILVMLDADGSADPAEIPRFVDALVAGADFAKGSRRLPSGGSDDITPLRSAGNRYLTWMVNRMYGTQYSDLCYGYNAFWRYCLPYMDVDCAGFEVETLINIRVTAAGLDVAEVPSHERGRIHGTSNLHPVRDGLRIQRTILRERRRPATIDFMPYGERRSFRDAVATRRRQTSAGLAGVEVWEG